ncbi:MAG: hypothetical protein U0527_00150 [Candidatus Eisenbacteria bacterium]
MSKRVLILSVSALGLGMVGVLFRQAQAAGALGGPISIPKQLWLCYTIFAWFVLPAIFAASRELAVPLRQAYRAHLLLWGARAVIELWLLYVTIGWTPLYGIAHDLSAIALLSYWIRRTRDVPGDSGWARLARHWMHAIRLALLPEILFAAWFRQANGGRVGIYFADESARFAAINRVTLLVVIAVYLHLAWCFLRFGRETRVNEATDAAS